METTAASGRVVRFGAFEADFRAGELRKSGLKIKLQGQPFQVLEMLLKHAGEVVTRDELQKAIWPGDCVVDFDQGLNKAINKIREALGEVTGSPRFLETLPRRGYRFVAQVTDLAAAPGATLVSSAAVSADSIVVLPFINMSGDTENEFFADGITEEIINALAHIGELHVVARSSAFSFKGKHIDARIVGEQLNVRTVLEGSVRRVGNRLRITCQLVNAADGYHLWSECYDREMEDVFEVQEEIARSIAGRLRITLQTNSQEPLIRAGTKNLAAYSLYLKGRALLYRRGVMISQALECFKRAVELDSEYALAWAGIADVYTLLGFYGFMHPEISCPKWREAAHHAIEADEFLAETHSAVGFGSLLYDWNRSQAEHEFQRALELNPRYVQARNWYALFYLQTAAGRLADGVKQAKLALEADPLSPYAHAMRGLTAGAAGDYLEAVRSSQRAVELDSESFFPRWCLQSVFYISGRFEEAVAAAQPALAMSGRHPWSLAILAATLASWGRVNEADAVYAEMSARSRREYVQPALLAIAAAAASRRDEALCHVIEALDIHDPWCFGFAPYWPHGRRLLADPRVDQMLKEKGLDWPALTP